MKTSALALLSGLLTFWTVSASALPIHNLTYDSRGGVAAGHLKHGDIFDTSLGSLDTSSLEVPTTGAMNAKDLKHQKKNNRPDKTGKRITRDEGNSDLSTVIHFAGTPVFVTYPDWFTHKESGNHAISSEVLTPAVLAVPDTGSTLAMAGFALAFLVAGRRYVFPLA